MMKLTKEDREYLRIEGVGWTLCLLSQVNDLLIKASHQDAASQRKSELRIISGQITKITDELDSFSNRHAKDKI